MNKRTHLLVGAVLLLAGLGSPAAEGRGTSASPQADAAKLGAQYFDQAARWLRGSAKPQKLRDFYADLEDLYMKVGKSKNEGYMRVWLKEPGKYRMELRPMRKEEGVSTKILDGGRMWIQVPNGKMEGKHGRSGGVEAIKQLQADRARLLDVASFVTLEGLKVPGAVFLHEGVHTGKKTLAGTRIRVRRRAPGHRDMIFHFDFVRDPNDKTGKTLIATSPGVIHIEGDPAQKIEAEYFVLDRWRQDAGHRIPGRIRALSRMQPQDKLQLFMRTFLRTMRINPGLSDETFAP